MKTIKLTFAGRSNLYRYSDKLRGNALPAVIEHFNKDPEARAALGRWSPCPNINVAYRIRASTNPSWVL